MTDDADLLRLYADEGSERSFTEVVHRHVDLVYGAALRRTGNPHLARDVAQIVFTSLARNARKLASHPALPAWLHVATRHAAASLMKSEHRRKVREHTAASDPALATDNVSWEALEPILDSAIDELGEADRAAIVLRFLERRSFADVGRALQLGEDAARQRTNRALEKMRAHFQRHGIRSSGAALATVLASAPAIAAPVGIASQVSAAALAGAGTAIVAGTTIFMTTKLIVTATLAAAIAFWAGTRVNSAPAAPAATPAPVQIAAQPDVSAALQEENRRLKSEVASLTADVTRLLEASEQTSAPKQPRSASLGMAPWEIHTAVMNNLRQLDAGRRHYVHTHGKPAASIHDIVGRRAAIRQLRTVDGEEYAGISTDPDSPLTVTTAGGLTFTYDPVNPENSTKRQIPPELEQLQAEARDLQPSVMKAMNAYQSANGKPPPNEEALRPFFENPTEGAKYVEIIKREKEIGP